MRRLALDVLIGVLAVSGVTLVAIGGSRPPDVRYVAGGVPIPASTAPETPPLPLPPDPVARDVPEKEAGPPTHLDIPAIGLSTPLMELGLNADRTVQVPPLGRSAPAGWYRHLAAPGEIGPAVLLGHVDSRKDGPAVFHRLHELTPGDTIAVRRTDGSSVAFRVTEVAAHPKSAFPADAVYGPVDRPVLRLVTCGGTFDRVRKEYRGNVVVYAELADTDPNR